MFVKNYKISYHHIDHINSKTHWSRAKMPRLNCWPQHFLQLMHQEIHILFECLTNPPKYVYIEIFLIAYGRYWYVDLFQLTNHDQLFLLPDSTSNIPFSTGVCKLWWILTTDRFGNEFTIHYYFLFQIYVWLVKYWLIDERSIPAYYTLQSFKAFHSEIIIICYHWQSRWPRHDKNPWQNLTEHCEPDYFPPIHHLRSCWTYRYQP